MSNIELTIATQRILSQRQGLLAEGATIVAPKISRDTQEILEAGLLSVQSGRAISPPPRIPRRAIMSAGQANPLPGESISVDANSG